MKPALLRGAPALLIALACAAPKPPPPTAPQTAPAAQPSAEAPAVDRSQVPPLGPNPDLTLPTQQHFSLSNGLKVRLVEQHRLPLVALDLVVDAGAARDPAGLGGLASFTAEMLTEGTRTRTATAISDQVGFLGASLEAAAGPDAATLSGGVLAEHLPVFLELFADVARNPSFPRADFERVADQRKVTLLQQLDQPETLSLRALVPLFWGAHPYGHPLIGTEDTLARTRRQDLVRFHQRYWVPANAELVVVGDVTQDQLRPLLEKALGGWAPGRAAAPIPPRAAAAPHRTVLIDKPGASQSYVRLAAPGLDRRSDDYVAASVLFEVLGGGMSSRLFRTLREEKGYTYGMGAVADARRLAGASVVVGSVKAEVTGPALEVLLEELRKLREAPVTPEELADAKEGLVRSLPSRFSTVGGIAGQLSALVVHGLPDDYWTRYAEAVEQVTPAEVQRVAQRYLDPKRFTLVLVGARDVVASQLASVPLGDLQLGKEPATRLLPRKPKAPVSSATGAPGEPQGTVVR